MFVMKTVILSENGYNKINDIIIKESYGDKVELIRKYLDNNFMRATFEKDGENVGIFVKLSNHLPTEKSFWRQDVLDILDKEFNNQVASFKDIKEGIISNSESKIPVYVLPTEEEVMIIRDTYNFIK